MVQATLFCLVDPLGCDTALYERIAVKQDQARLDTGLPPLISHDCRGMVKTLRPYFAMTALFKDRETFATEFPTGIVSKGDRIQRVSYPTGIVLSCDPTKCIKGTTSLQ